ncbi:hypothetical protein L7F22_020157 [Adiantum nelumboides]|nr:hypothetical protein [Adiantum nelumboides]
MLPSLGEDGFQKEGDDGVQKVRARPPAQHVAYACGVEPHMLIYAKMITCKPSMYKVEMIDGIHHYNQMVIMVCIWIGTLHFNIRERHARRRHKSKRTPSPSSSPSKRSSFSSSSSSDGYSSSSHHKRRRHDTYRAWKRSRKLQKFKEGGKSITFQTYDGSYGATDKVLCFIQQFDAAFGSEDFTESSELRHLAMHFTKAARQWWTSLKNQDIHPRTWKLCRAAIMKQFLTEDAKDEVLTAWRELKLEKGESIQQYITNIWDLHLKAIVFKKIDFAEQRQQYCAGLTEDIRAYVNDQKPRTIAEVIHRSKVAMKIFPISKGTPKPFERNEKVHGREQVLKDSKGNGSKGKKDKVPYKGPRILSPEEMERYKKENRCYKCGETRHISRACPKRQQRKETPQATQILYPTKEAKEAS